MSESITDIWPLKGLVAFVEWWKERFLHICLWLRYIYIWLQSYHSYNHMNKDVNKPYGLSLWQHRSKFEEYFQMAKIFLLPETDFPTDRSSYIQIPPPPLPKIPKDDFPSVVGQVSLYSLKAGIKWTKPGSCFPPPKHTFSMTKVTGPALMQGVIL